MNTARARLIASGLRGAVGTGLLGLVAVLIPLLPSTAGAYAVPVFPSYDGQAALPDGRVYEQVSPRAKNGNYVASGGVRVVEGRGYAAASANGEAIVFLGSGAMGDAASSVAGPYVARRSASGWNTSSATSPELGVPTLGGSPLILLPSADFSSFAFGAFFHAYSPEQPFTAGQAGESVNIYRSTNPFEVPAWLGKPTIANPIPALGSNEEREDYIVAGATADLNTVYFAYSGTLVAQDKPRAPNVGDGLGDKATDPWGLYEWSNGTLQAAGVLPDNSVSPFGAMPAAEAGDPENSRAERSSQAADFNNQVSPDGSSVFFVSPDPVASTVTDQEGCENEGPCTTAPPELYLRRTAPDGAKSTDLVSRSLMTGQPASSGPVGVTDALIQAGGPEDESYVYSSPDGTEAFFASRDRLTEAAPEDASVKEYRFDVSSEHLEYMQAVVGPILASSSDGSTVAFKNTTTVPEELDIWRAGSGGGTVQPVAQLPPPGESPGEPYNGALGVESRMNSSGTTLVFDTNAPVPGGFNNLLGFGEVYRYDLPSNALTCVSCPPSGVTPGGNAYISYDNKGGGEFRPKSTEDTRAMTADGSKVFFDTPDPLVARDTDGTRDVYEWDNGLIYLISAGTSPEESFYLDNSESGADVFFSTSSGLLPNDVDGVYDVYDARVPRPSDTSPPEAAPCEGEACQAAPGLLSIFSPPQSATFSGNGNLPPGNGESTSKPASKPVKKRTTQRKHKKHKRRRKAKGKKADAKANREALR